MTNPDTISKAEIPDQQTLEANLPSLDNKLDPESIPDKTTTNRMDLSKALSLRLRNKLSYGAIGKQLNVSKQAVWERLKPFEALIDDPDMANAYDDNRANLLNSAEMEILKEILDSSKLQKASVNNLAYAYKTLFESRRISKGETLGIYEHHTVTAKLSELDKEEADLRRELEGN